MTKLLILILFCISNISCSAIAIKGDERMILKGFGAKSATFADGSKIEKDTTLKVPNILSK